MEIPKSKSHRGKSLVNFEYLYMCKYIRIMCACVHKTKNIFNNYSMVYMCAGVIHLLAWSQ